MAAKAKVFRSGYQNIVEVLGYYQNTDFGIAFDYALVRTESGALYGVPTAAIEIELTS